MYVSLESDNYEYMEGIPEFMKMWTIILVKRLATLQRCSSSSSTGSNKLEFICTVSNTK